MRGIVYSADKSLGYSHVLIKLYGDNFEQCIDETKDYQLYTFSRDKHELRLVYSPDTMKDIWLSLALAEELLGLVIAIESKTRFPAELSWEAFPDGRPTIRSVKDMNGIWPVEPAFMCCKKLYFNITDMYYDKAPSYLEASFLCEVLNEAIYLSGVYISDSFMLCGNNVFCSLELAHVINKLYSDKPFLSALKQNKQKDLPEFKRKYILSKLASLDFEQYTPVAQPHELLILLKTEAVELVTTYIYKSLKFGKSFKWLVEGIYSPLEKAISDIQRSTVPYMTYSEMYKSSDIKYFHFRELLGCFAFGQNMVDGVRLVRKNRERYSWLKKYDVPGYLYNGKYIAG